MAGQFRYTVWDPFMIISQILTLQCIFYVSLGLWLSFFDLVAGNDKSLDQIFKYQELQFSSFNGKIVGVAFALTALNCALGLWYVVQRTKLCLDFSCTIYFLHLAACIIYNGSIPTTFSWWLINIVSTMILCVTAEFLCMRTELQSIPVNMAPKTDL
jgi:hypothetical protein